MNRTIRALLAAAAFGATAHAQMFTVVTGGLAIPDGLASGIISRREIDNVPSLLTSIRVSVVLDVVGDEGFSGDLFLTLEHQGRMAVLMNRMGADEERPGGYGDSTGIHVTLYDSAAADIHHYRLQATGDEAVPLSGTLLGSWQPDGRDMDPGGDVWSAPRTRMLNTFHGADPNGTWTLFAADMSTGAAYSITSWSIQIAAVPEPEWTMAAVTTALAAWSLYRHRRGRNPASRAHG